MSYRRRYMYVRHMDRVCCHSFLGTHPNFQQVHFPLVNEHHLIFTAMQTCWHLAISSSFCLEMLLFLKGGSLGRELEIVPSFLLCVQSVAAVTPGLGVWGITSQSRLCPLCHVCAVQPAPPAPISCLGDVSLCHWGLAVWLWLPWSGFSYANAVWNWLRFLNLWVYSLHKIWSTLALFLKTFFLFLLPQLYVYWTTCYCSSSYWWLVYYFLSFFLPCFILDSSYCRAFKLASHFSWNVLSVVHLSQYAFLSDAVFFTSRGSIQIFFITFIFFSLYSYFSQPPQPYGAYF